MRRLGRFCRIASPLALLLLFLPAPARAQIAPGPYYARGTYFCSSSLNAVVPPDTCYGYGDVLQLYDDGAHDDGAAGDGVYGCWVTCNQAAGVQQFKVANADWTFNAPNAPANSIANGLVFVAGPGDIIHFRLDTSAPAYGWQPAVSVSNDHGYPAGSTLELIGAAPELGSWVTGQPVDHIGTMWSRKLTIATPGTYEFKFRVQGTWAVANFGLQYNNGAGDNGSVTTTRVNEDVVFQFDELTGRIRAIDDANTPARTPTWGALKSRYR